MKDSMGSSTHVMLPVSDRGMTGSVPSSSGWELAVYSGEGLAHLKQIFLLCVGYPAIVVG